MTVHTRDAPVTRALVGALTGNACEKIDNADVARSCVSFRSVAAYSRRRRSLEPSAPALGGPLSLAAIGGAGNEDAKENETRLPTRHPLGPGLWCARALG